jgi:hypothetical protein
MNVFLQVFVTVSTVVIAVAVSMAAMELRKVRYLIEELVYSGISSTVAQATHSPAHGQAIYISKGGEWVLASDTSAPGYHAVPPGMAASYEGQVVKLPSEPDSSP